MLDVVLPCMQQELQWYYDEIGEAAEEWLVAELGSGAVLVFCQLFYTAMLSCLSRHVDMLLGNSYELYSRLSFCGRIRCR